MRIDNHKLAIFTHKRKKSSFGCINENEIMVLEPNFGENRSGVLVRAKKD
jgi:hypothetical protein